MNPATDRFIELAIRPLAPNAELQSAAKTDLQMRLADHHASSHSITEAADLLEEADRHPRRRYWRPALYVATLLVSLPMLVLPLLQLRRFAGVNSLITPGAKVPALGIDLTAHLTPEEKLLLRGDFNAVSESDRWKPLWDSDRENPAYLLEYATAYHRQHNSLTPEILAAAARIDPDNAWYSVIQAAEKAKIAVKKESPGYYARQRGEKPTLTVTNAEEFAKALDLLHQASGKPRLSAGSPELMKQRIGLLPERRDFASKLPSMGYLAAQNYGTLDFRHLADAISIRAGQCAEQKDAAAFRQLVNDWRWLASTTAKDGTLLVDVLIARALFIAPLTYLRDAAQALGLEEDARRFDALHLREEARRARVKQESRGSEESHLIESKGSMMAHLTMPMVSRQVASPPPITDSDLRPGRYADHALIGRIHALASWLLLGFASLAALGRSRRGEITRHLSKRFQDLLQTTDWGWIFIGGIIAPLLWGFVITRLSPLSAREWSVNSSGFLLPGTQLGSITILVLTASSVMVSRQLQQRAGFLVPRPRAPWLGWLAIACAALAIPLVGTLMLLPGGFGHLIFQVGCTLTGLALLWLAWGVCHYAIGRPVEGALRRATQARLVIPAWIFGMLMFSLLGLGHYAEEGYWIQQDRLLESTAELPAPTRYEWEVTQVLRKELLGMMEMAD